MNTVSTTMKKTDSNGNCIEIHNSSGFQVSVRGKRNDIRINNSNPEAKVRIDIRGDGNIIHIGKCILKDFSLTIGSHQPVHGVHIRIGDHFSIEPGGAFEIFTDFAQVDIGESCMFSRNITLHFGDNPHLIFDKETGAYIDGDGAVLIGKKGMGR